MSVTVIQDSDLIKTDGYAFLFDASPETLIIRPGIVVESTITDAIESGGPDSTLRNSGLVFSDGGDAVHFIRANSTVINFAGAIIHGMEDGISLGHASPGLGNQVVTNHGTITATSVAVRFLDGGDDVVLTNDGYIYGYDKGVSMTSQYSGGTITNSGVIRSSFGAVFIDTAGNLTAVLNNTATGVISDPHSAVIVKTGMLSLNNAGRINGNVDSAVGRDSIVNSGIIDGTVNLDANNDVYRGVGNGSVTGGVHGEAGNDRFIADKAKESFFGETGADTFIFGSILFSPAGAKRDTIGGFNHGELDRISVHAIDADTIHAGNQNFVFIGTDSFSHFHSVRPGVVGMIRFDAATHRLQGNVNGDFAHADFEVNLPGVPSLQASDLVL